MSIHYHFKVSSEEKVHRLLEKMSRLISGFLHSPLNVNLGQVLCYFKDQIPFTITSRSFHRQFSEISKIVPYRFTTRRSFFYFSVILVRVLRRNRARGPFTVMPRFSQCHFKSNFTLLELHIL